MKWNDRYKIALNKAGIKAIKMAELIKASPPSLSDWERGITVNPNSDMLLKASKVLGVSPYWIMYGEEDPNKVSAAGLELAKKFDQLSEHDKGITIGLVDNMLNKPNPDQKRLIDQKKQPSVNQANKKIVGD